MISPGGLLPTATIGSTVFPRCSLCKRPVPWSLQYWPAGGWRCACGETKAERTEHRAATGAVSRTAAGGPVPASTAGLVMGDSMNSDPVRVTFDFDAMPAKRGVFIPFRASDGARGTVWQSRGRWHATTAAGGRAANRDRVRAAETAVADSAIPGGPARPQ